MHAKRKAPGQPVRLRAAHTSPHPRRRLAQGGLAALALVTLTAAGWLWVSRSAATLWSLAAGGHLPPLPIDHPIEGAVLPRNLPAPALLWQTNGMLVDRWAAGFQVGDRRWLFENVFPHWRPAETDWFEIKRAATGQPVELAIAGYTGPGTGTARVAGRCRFVVSSESVTAPLFFREVNLPFREAVKDPSKIRWRFGGLDQGTPPPVVLNDMPVCGNCHSFDRNGRFLAMDVDYGNSKGSYVIAPTGPQMSLTTNDIITWDDYRREDGDLTLGLLSQISPDGRYVLSTVKDLSVFMPMPDLAFSQLFFPIKGIVGVYDRETRRFSALPGANDPEWVQSNPTWSPDGRWVLFARAPAVQMKRPQRGSRPLFSGPEADEFLRKTRQYRYDLYRVEFNGGKGGQAEPVRGASQNGRSNYFPKYSPDGRWIVFCQASNYMLLQPDSRLFTIPAEGGEARPLGCNLGRMNSWHSWSPDGRWLVFSSKAHSDYTQLYLARMDTQGQASPPVWLAHLVEPGRAANIPEFVNLPAQGILQIREAFLDDAYYAQAGDEFGSSGEFERARENYRKCLALNPTNAHAHHQLGRLSLSAPNREKGLEHLETAARLAPDDAVVHFHLGFALKEQGDEAKALLHFEAALRGVADPDDPRYRGVDAQRALPQAIRYALALGYQKAGRLPEAERCFREAVQSLPDDVELQYRLGSLLVDTKKFAEADEHLATAIRLRPDFASAHNALGIARLRQGRRSDASACFQRAVRIDPSFWQARLNLANLYLAENDVDKAIPELREVLRLSPDCASARKALERASQMRPASPQTP